MSCFGTRGPARTRGQYWCRCFILRRAKQNHGYETKKDICHRATTVPCDREVLLFGNRARAERPVLDPLRFNRNVKLENVHRQAQRRARVWNIHNPRDRSPDGRARQQQVYLLSRVSYSTESACALPPLGSPLPLIRRPCANRDTVSGRPWHGLSYQTASDTQWSAGTPGGTPPSRRESAACPIRRPRSPQR